MIALTKTAAELAWPLATSILVLLAGLAAAIFVRRIVRGHPLRRLDRVRAARATIMAEFAAGRMVEGEAIARLRPLCTRPDRRSFEELLLADVPWPPQQAALLASLCADAGLTGRWTGLLAQRPNARGRGRTRRGAPKSRRRLLRLRARRNAAELLGVIRHQPSWPLLVDALNDPDAAVQSAAVRSLARIQEPASLPALSDRLREAVLGRAPEVSERALKMALAAFPPSCAAALRPLLAHAEPRVRAAGADAAAGMLHRERARNAECTGGAADLPSDVRELFQTSLAQDTSAEVRARAADVMGCVGSWPSPAPLLQLANDTEWFVRLHATRALGRLTVTPHAALLERLVDSHWRVREAAAQALAAQGPLGLTVLLDHFLTTTDRYSREQVAEQIERSGLLGSCVGLLADAPPGRRAEFVSTMALAGRSAALSPFLCEAGTAAKNSEAGAAPAARPWIRSGPQSPAPGSAGSEREAAGRSEVAPRVPAQEAVLETP